MQDKPLLDGVTDKAGEELGMGRWDRPTVFRDAASAATDADLPYWLVLLLSGTIATLGLALNSAAVVIGAMLVAPLLSPVVGLALALAVGDGRLAIQTAVMVLASTLAVIAVAALLTLALPYHSVTAEITARTRPTTLDLAIAVASGLAGVVVTVARGHRLSAAIPGVAISVALIPPLGVAGFGIGAGWNWVLIRGSLLLYAANLAGIVLSGMLVFMLVGMHRAPVLEAAQRWQEEGHATGLVAWLSRFRWVRSLGIIRSQWARVGLVVGFVVALAFPLSRTLEEITREVRVNAAVENALERFDVPGRSSVIDRRVVRGAEGTRVFLRVATTRGVDPATRATFERSASAAAREPVNLVLEQVPASRGDLDDLARLFPGGGATAALPAAPTAPPALPAMLEGVRERLQEALATLPLPRGTQLAGTELLVGGAGGRVRVAYLAAEPLQPQAAEILGRSLARTLEAPELVVEFSYIPAEARVLTDSIPHATVAGIAQLLRDFRPLRAELLAGPEAVARAGAVRARLNQAGADSARVAVLPDSTAGLRLRLRLRTAPVPASPE